MGGIAYFFGFSTLTSLFTSCPSSAPHPIDKRVKVKMNIRAKSIAKVKMSIGK
jgi:hypothetical protein